MLFTYNVGLCTAAELSDSIANLSKNFPEHPPPTVFASDITELHERYYYMKLSIVDVIESV